VSTGLSLPHCTPNMFGAWPGGFNNNLKPFVLLGWSPFRWSMWLCSNDFFFGEKTVTTPLQLVIYSVIHWFRTWASLQKATSHGLVVAACQQFPASQGIFYTGTWVAVYLVLRLRITGAFIFLFRMCAPQMCRGREDLKLTLSENKTSMDHCTLVKGEVTSWDETHGRWTTTLVLAVALGS
jgi:hypothetical protein